MTAAQPLQVLLGQSIPCFPSYAHSACDHVVTMCCRVQQAAQQAPGLRHLTSLASDPAAAGATGASVAPAAGSVGSSMTLFAAVASRLLNCLNQTSHAAICRYGGDLLHKQTADG
jgi:hypothetical protein